MTEVKTTRKRKTTAPKAVVDVEYINNTKVNIFTEKGRIKPGDTIKLSSITPLIPGLVKL